MNLFTKWKEVYRLREGAYGYQGEKVEGRANQEVWDGHEHRAIFKMDNQQGPTVQHRNSAQYYATT